jgi:hypothetical protein
MYVEQVVAHVVQRVGGYPAERPLGAQRPVIDKTQFPVGGVEATQDVGQQPRGHRQLLGDLDRVLLGVSLVGHTLVAAHWHRGGYVGTARQQHSLTLGE